MILNVQTNLNQIIPDTIRERKEEKKKQIKFIIQIIVLSIERATRSRNLFKIGHTHNVLFQSVRDMISEVLVLRCNRVVRAHVRYHNLWWTIDIRDSGNEPLHRVLWRVLLRCCAWPSVFSPPIVPPLCLSSSYSPVDPTGRTVSFRRKGGSSSGAGSWPDIVCHTLASTPTLHLLYSPPFARCTLVNPRFIMRRI